MANSKYTSPSRYCTTKASRYRVIGFIVLGFIILGSLWRYQGVFDSSRRVLLGEHVLASDPLESVPLTHKNIAVASTFGFHFDVYMTVAWTLQRVMKGEGNVHVYGPQPFYYDFGRIVDEYGLFNGTVKDDKELMSDILVDGDGAIDLLVLGTCEIECVIPPPRRKRLDDSSRPLSPAYDG
ncbi:hypothetical protein GALMADRAFT_386327 [Galerina marginata CBS 339.88]|uniref:Uncharacterized protein n=1 Tax=Galerina marginata (strain CBS 339.88) TaxID=685588 RepID=A0A067U2Z0_GALM3|nr:hypothetical protein GALMADRAFT_386327 [Galerina marginata CBS 339.88]